MGAEPRITHQWTSAGAIVCPFRANARIDHLPYTTTLSMDSTLLYQGSKSTWETRPNLNVGIPLDQWTTPPSMHWEMNAAEHS